MIQLVDQAEETAIFGRVHRKNYIDLETIGRMTAMTGMETNDHLLFEAKLLRRDG